MDIEHISLLTAYFGSNCFRKRSPRNSEPLCYFNASHRRKLRCKKKYCADIL